MPLPNTVVGECIIAFQEIYHGHPIREAYSVQVFMGASDAAPSIGISSPHTPDVIHSSL
jgi:hypothetical protein